MRKFRRTLSALLVLIMIAAACPIIPGVLAAGDVSAAELPTIPDGYRFSGRRIIDEADNVYYYVVSEPSEFGLVNGCWIDRNGNETTGHDANMVRLDSYETADQTALPSSYDARDYGLITSVKDQIGGTCWAFSGAACMEASAIIRGFGTADSLDISEYHTVWYTRNGYYSGNSASANDGWSITNLSAMLDDGGNCYYYIDPLQNFSGAISESTAGLTSKTESALLSEMKSKFTYDKKFQRDIVFDDMQEVKFTQENVKRAVMEHGAVSIAYASNTNYYTDYYGTSSAPATYYYPYKQTTNHAVTLVGWDDNFSRSNFSSNAKPQNDGAWLIKNSWGSDMLDDGYFWLSYEDKTIDDCFYILTAADAEDFRNVYMYDGQGCNQEISAAAEANIFIADGDEYLTKVSYGSVEDCSYTLKIYKDLPSGYTDPTSGTLAYTQSGKTNNQKYIDITGRVDIAAGERFAVVIEGVGAKVEGANYTLSSTEALKFTSNSKESYYRDTAGKWYDAKAQGYNNVCVRAVTKNQSDGDTYKVTFSCPDGKYSDVKYTSAGTVILPNKDGYTYTFTYDGKPFDGTGVDRDMTVIMHCYETNGAVTESAPCTTEYRCIYCGLEIEPAVTAHRNTVCVITPDDNTIGYTKQTCSVCGETSADAFTFSENAAQTGTIEDTMTAWQIVGDILTVGGVGNMKDFASKDEEPWIDNSGKIHKINVNEGITSIGSYAFYWFFYNRELNIASTVTEIHSAACWQMEGLQALVLPENLTYVGANAFGHTKKITSLTVPKDAVLGSKAFVNCASLTDVYFADGTTAITTSKISTFTFADCNAVAAVHLPQTVTVYANNSLRTESFDVDANNTALHTVDGVLMSTDNKTLYAYPARATAVYYSAPATVNSIAPYAFHSCENLRFLDLSASAATVLQGYTVYDCSALTNLNLPASATTLQNSALRNLSSLTKIYIPSTVKSIGTGNLLSCTVYTDTDSSSAKTYAANNNLSYTVITTPHAYSEFLFGSEPTCAVPGLNAKACECGQFSYATEPATGMHDWQWIVDKQPGCGITGLQHRECSVCGSKQDLNVEIAATSEHDFDVVVVPASCTEDGYTEYTCKNCTYSYTDRITEKTGHTWEWVIDREPTCGTDGYKHEQCSVCLQTQNENTIMNATGAHSLTAVTVPASCTADGYIAYVCKNCDYSYKGSTIPATGHSWSPVVDREPTCGTAGYQHEVCTKCNATQNLNTVIEPTGIHSYSFVVTPATCTEVGFTTYTCKNCSDSYIGNYTDKTEHGWKWITDREATCDTTGVRHEQCEVCGAKRSEGTVIPATGAHSWQWIVDREATCTTDGARHEQCEICGAKKGEGALIPATGEHQWQVVIEKEATCAEPGIAEKICDTCGAHISEELPRSEHVDQNKDGVCDICNNDLDINCDCMCHSSSGFVQMFYKIIRFFWKIMGVNKECKCGHKIHY